jgi:hypothetical protein
MYSQNCQSTAVLEDQRFCSSLEGRKECTVMMTETSGTLSSKDRKVEATTALP